MVAPLIQLSLPFEQLYPGDGNKGYSIPTSQSDIQSFNRRSNEKARFEEMIRQEVFFSEPMRIIYSNCRE